MHLDDIRTVLRHGYNRQAESGPESAFRFGMFVGPKKTRLRAKYPGTLINQETELEENSNDVRKKKKGKKGKKGKGKQREDPLQGLLRIDETETVQNDNRQNLNPSAAGPSNRSRNAPESSALPPNDMVRVGMAQMLQLKDMGYDVLGPVNGPNEGLPQYEVPKAWVDLISQSELQHARMPNEPGHCPQPPMTEPNWTESQQDIDPVLLAHTTHEIPLDHPTTPPNTNADSGADPERIRHKTPDKQLGKRSQANLSPQAMRQTQSKKKKKVTGDDLAALEAQEMMQSGSRRRGKRTQRK